MPVLIKFRERGFFGEITQRDHWASYEITCEHSLCSASVILSLVAIAKPPSSSLRSIQVCDGETPKSFHYYRICDLARSLLEHSWLLL